MPVWQVLFDFGAGFVDVTSHIKAEDSHLTIFNEIHNNLAPSTDEANFTLGADAAFQNQILSGTADIGVRINEDGVRRFTGILQRIADTSVAANLQPMNVKAYDLGIKLKKKPSTAYSAWGKTASAIVTELITAGGLTDIAIDSLTTVIDAISFDTDTTYFDAIKAVLDPFGYVLYFDAYGTAKTFNLFPSTASSTKTFSTGQEGNVLESFSISQKAKRYRGTRLTFHRHDARTNLVVFSDSSGATALTKCLIDLTAHSGVYPDRAAGATGDVYCEYAVTERGVEKTILATNGCSLSAEGSGFTVEQFVDYKTKAALKITGTGMITKLDVVAASAVLQGAEVIKESIISGLTADLEVVESSTIVDDTVADRFVSGHRNYWQFSALSFQFLTQDAVDRGQVVTLQEVSELGTNVLALVRSISEDDRGFKTVVCEAVMAYAAAEVSSQATMLPAPYVGGTIISPATAPVVLVCDAQKILVDRVGTYSPSGINVCSRAGDGAAFSGIFKLYRTPLSGAEVLAYQSPAAESAMTYTIADETKSLRAEFYKILDGQQVFATALTIDVQPSYSAQAQYWGALNSAPTDNLIDGDTYFLKTALAAGGGDGYYYNASTATWVAITSSWSGYYNFVSKAITDIIVWAGNNPTATGTLVTSAQLVVQNIIANGAFIDTLFSNKIAVPDGGRIRYYNGQGVNKRCVQLAKDRVDFLDTPNDAVADEVLRARIGRLGVGSTILMDGQFLTNLAAPWSSEVVVNSTPVGTMAYCVRASGEVRMAYYTANGIYERVKAAGSETWGSAVPLSNTLGYGFPNYIERKNGELRLSICSITSRALLESVYSGSAWGQFSTITASNASGGNYIETSDGVLRIAYRNYDSGAVSGSIVEKLYDDSALAWGAASAAIATQNGTSAPEYLETASGELHIAYKGTSGLICEKIMSEGAWSSEVPISTVAGYMPAYVETVTGDLRLSYADSAGLNLYERIKTKGVWGADTVIVTGSNYPAYAQELNGTLRIAYYRNSDGYLCERTLKCYARIGAGIVAVGVNASGAKYYQLGNGDIIGEPHPVGTVYFRLPGYKAPDALWPGTWSDITASFAGYFFRAAGGNGLGFEVGAQGQSIQPHSHPITSMNYGLQGGSGYVAAVKAGTASASTDSAGSVETRPMNYSIKIYVRTA